MSMCLNNEKKIWNKVIKPCRICGFCPYGQLVEAFPLKSKRNKESCEIFGHECPAFYLAEPMCEEKEITKAQFKECMNEFIKFSKGGK